MSASEETLRLLKSIDASLKTLVSIAQRKQQKAAGPAIASDRELDGKYGDPVVKLTPRDWTGPSFKNARMSQCDPAFLDQLADLLDYLADKAEQNNETHNGKPVAPYKRKDAARARGWAKRIRAGKSPVVSPSAPPPSAPVDPSDFTPEGWESPTSEWEGSFS